MTMIRIIFKGRAFILIPSTHMVYDRLRCLARASSRSFHLTIVSVAWLHDNCAYVRSPQKVPMTPAVPTADQGSECNAGRRKGSTNGVSWTYSVWNLDVGVRASGFDFLLLSLICLRIFVFHVCFFICFFPVQIRMYKTFLSSRRLFFFFLYLQDASFIFFSLSSRRLFFLSLSPDA